MAASALLVDVGPGWQRATEGKVPGALLVERNRRTVVLGDEGRSWPLRRSVIRTS
ncbi:MAG TPA: hypothetical protein VGP04_11835 [Pseudonocardiaceae bacterium]|jgi:hypothetical protein|nr:hypothetical protein [Pseudonocardiaceae bacterium]